MNPRNLPWPELAMSTQSPTLIFFTPLPTARTSPTPSLPPTAGRQGLMGYVPNAMYILLNI